MPIIFLDYFINIRDIHPPITEYDTLAISMIHKEKGACAPISYLAKLERLFLSAEDVAIAIGVITTSIEIAPDGGTCKKMRF